ncbi:ABC transporter permease/substrate-binding protein [Actinomycetes bacterium NPDC127524]
MNTFTQVLNDRKGELLQAILEHIQISFIALLISIIISIPLGVYLTRKEKLAESIIGVTAVLQTIPSLALLGLLIPLFGIGKVPAIIALVVYALLPIIRNTYTGIKEVDPALIEAADAMGMNTARRLVKVELPLAMPVIMAGVRTAMVLIIGTATLAALIGAGGLGDLILLGIDRNNTSLIILGAVPAAILAILFDRVLRIFERISFKKSASIIGAAFAAAILLLIIPSITENKKDSISIAGKLGSEPEILINMYKLLIEKDTDLEVNLKPGLGKTPFVFNALKTGNADIYPEFTGTAISTFLKETAVSTNSKEVYDQAREGMAKKYSMEFLKPMSYNNTYALAVPESFAKKYNLTKISDLGAIQDKIKAGFTLEFKDRDDGYKGIKKLYKVDFPEVRTMEPKLRYQAVKSGDINLVDAYSTDSELRQYRLKVLEDDKHLFPPYQGAPLMKKSLAEQYPGIKKALNKLSGKISDDDMRVMNYQVNVENKSALQVAKTYLKSHGILK